MKPLIVSYLDHYIYFCDALCRKDFPTPHNFIETDDNSLEDCFNMLKEGHDVIVWTSHGIRNLYRHLVSNYIYVKAAGGLVMTDDESMLTIYRDGRWDLPKGMVEPKESTAHAAIREVQEETGIQRIALEHLILKTYHIYDKYGGWHMKQTSWFKMKSSAKEEPCPQLEEGITKAVWLPKNECLNLLDHSFASLRLVSQKLKQ